MLTPDELDKEHVCSAKQHQTLTLQCLGLIHFYEACAQKYSFDSEGTEVEKKMIELADAAGSCLRPKVSGRTILEWHRQYQDNDSHFPLDGRGHFERSWILNEDDLLRKFRNEMKELAAKEELDMDVAVKFVNEDLLKDEDAALKKHGLSLPIANSTVWRWVKKLPDTSYEEAKKTYYTDNHEKESTVRYRG